MTLIILIISTTLFVIILLSLIIYTLHYCLDEEISTNSINNENKLPNNLKVNYNDYRKILISFEDFNKLTQFEKLTYLLSIAYCKINDIKLIENKITLINITSESLLIRDRGINAFYFQEYYDQINTIVSKLQQLEEEEEDINETTSLIKDTLLDDFNNNSIYKLLKRFNYWEIIPKIPPFIIEDLIEINFKSKLGDSIYSTILNLPIPTFNRKNNIIYFECKLLEFNELNNLLSIGLVSDINYPNFQLPGILPYSIAIESTGNLRLTNKINNNLQNNEIEMIVLPKLNEGDIIGLGYRSISGSIFLTHNGKLIYEIIKNFKFNLYPCIGIKSINGGVTNTTKINVNLGQLGFVYIEGNVKKLGFCENNNDGIIGAPPIYNKLIENGKEILLDKGDEIPPNYNYNRDESFFNIIGTSSEKPVRNTTPVSDPPSYNEESNTKNKKSKKKHKKKHKNKNKTLFK